MLDAVGTVIRPREPVGDVYSRAAHAFGAAIEPLETEHAFRSAFANAKPPPLRPGPAPDDERDWWRALVGKVFDHFAQTSRPTFDRKGCFAAIYDEYAKPETWMPYPEVREFLGSCQAAGLRLAIVSNFDRRLHGILQGLELDGFFDAVIISSEVGARKPHPIMFERALGALGCEASAALHIGDDPIADWQGARNSGIGVFELDRKTVTLASLWLQPRPEFQNPFNTCAPRNPVLENWPSASPEKRG